MILIPFMSMILGIILFLSRRTKCWIFQIGPSDDMRWKSVVKWELTLRILRENASGLERKRKKIQALWQEANTAHAFKKRASGCWREIQSFLLLPLLSKELFSLGDLLWAHVLSGSWVLKVSHVSCQQAASAKHTPLKIPIGQRTNFRLITRRKRL